MPIVFAKPILPASNLAASFNGTTSTLQRSNTGIIGASQSAGSWSAWIKLDATRLYGFMIGAADSVANRSTMSAVGGTMFTNVDKFNHRWWQSGSVDHAFNMNIIDSDISDLESSLCHVVINYPGNNVEGRVWINGELVGWMRRTVNSGSFNPTSSTIQIGSGITGETSGYSKGIVKNVVFTDAHMDTADAVALYALGPEGNPLATLSGTVTAWYPLNGDFNDASGNGYHMTDTDVTWVAQPAVTSAPVVLKFSDTFTDTNGTTVISHTPDLGPNWFETRFTTNPIISGSATIQSNQAEFANDNQSVSTDIGRQNIKAEMQWSVGVSALNRSSMMFCHRDKDNFGYLNIREDNNDIALRMVEGGVATGLDLVSFTWTEGQTYTIKLELDEFGTARGYIDNVLKVTLAIPRSVLDEHSYGFGRNTGSPASKFDTYTITTL